MMLSDIRQALRTYRAAPRLTLTALVCTTLGLGAAIFMATIVRAVLFASPTMPESGRLVRVWTSDTTTRETLDVSYQDVLALRARARSFDAVEAASRTRGAHTTDAGTERLRGESVTPGYFGLIGARAAQGRLFTTAEYEPTVDQPVVIGHALWQRRYNGRPDVIGQPFRTRTSSRLGGETVRTIVGVMPAGFVGTVDPDVSEFWIPVAHYQPAAQLSDPMTRSTWVLARLAPGASIAQAQAEVTAIASSRALEHPAAYDGATLTAEPFGESWRERFRLSLYTLLAAAGLLLLISCANVAAMLLARIAERQSELRIRMTLGADRRRIVRQLLIESLVLAGAGGLAGIGLAAVAVKAIASAGVLALPPYVTIAIDLPAAAVAVALVVLTGLLFGVLPARASTGTNAQPARDSGVRLTLGRRERRRGQTLVVAQVSLAFVMLVGATLLFRTHQNLTHHDPGFRTRDLLRLALTPDPGAFPTAASRLALAENIKRSLDGYPGVERSAVIAGVLPPWFDDVVDVTLEGDTQLRDVGRHAVGPDFLQTMGIALRSGRAFAPSDRQPGAVTALAGESLARKLGELSGGRGVAGRRFRLTRPGMTGSEEIEIVGVVSDVQYNGPLRLRPADHDLYVPLERGESGPFSVAVHTRVDAATLIEPLTRELGRLAPTSPQHWVSTMEAELALQFQDARLHTWLSGFYGIAATLLSLLGVYGVLANQVARRSRELGVRLAVGAQRGSIVNLVLGEGLRTVGLGVTIGLALSLAGTRLLGRLLFGVAPNDGLVLGQVAVILLAFGCAAALVPSLRAARVNPVEALK